MHTYTHPPALWVLCLALELAHLEPHLAGQGHRQPVVLIMKVVLTNALTGETLAPQEERRPRSQERGLALFLTLLVTLGQSLHSPKAGGVCLPA